MRRRPIIDIIGETAVPLAQEKIIVPVRVQIREGRGGERGGRIDGGERARARVAVLPVDVILRIVALDEAVV